jgi:hypothetical protein
VLLTAEIEQAHEPFARRLVRGAAREASGRAPCEQLQERAPVEIGILHVESQRSGGRQGLSSNARRACLRVAPRASPLC